ncbi:MAG: hypothetical protein PHW74_07260 [Desulfobacca sp.]|nr:hypothetical protein [Desulfobacca sp.]
MSDGIDVNRLALLIAERLQERGTIQGRIPFLTGDLRKSIQAQLIGQGLAVVGSILPYARAVHDGRPALTIRPRRKKALYWEGRTVGSRYFPGAPHPLQKVFQPARKGKPFLRQAAEEMERTGFDFLVEPLKNQVSAALSKYLPRQIKVHIMV